jgi:hypothetical protein
VRVAAEVEQSRVPRVIAPVALEDVAVEVPVVPRRRRRRRRRRRQRRRRRRRLMEDRRDARMRRSSSRPGGPDGRGKGRRRRQGMGRLVQDLVVVELEPALGLLAVSRPAQAQAVVRRHAGAVPTSGRERRNSKVRRRGAFHGWRQFGSWWLRLSSCVCVMNDEKSERGWGATMSSRSCPVALRIVQTLPKCTQVTSTPKMPSGPIDKIKKDFRRSATLPLPLGMRTFDRANRWGPCSGRSRHHGQHFAMLAHP